MKRILVSGVTGRVGANMAVELLQRGYEVRGMVMPGDLKEEKLAKLDIEVVYADLTDEEAIEKAIVGMDGVVHFAAQMGKGDTPTSRFFDVNVKGTLHLLEAAARAKRPIERFVFASTGATYSGVNAKYSPIDESHPQDPPDDYGLGKVLCEKLCFGYLTHWDLPTTVVRFATVLVPDEVLNWFRYDQILAMLKLSKYGHRGRDNVMWWISRDVERPWEYLEQAVPDDKGNPAVGLTDQQGRPWAIHITDVRDSVEGAMLALESDAAVGEAFNVVGPATTAFDQGAQVIGEALDLPCTMVKMPFRLYIEISNAKAMQMLGYRPQYDHQKMVESALAFRAGEDIGVIPV